MLNKLKKVIKNEKGISIVETVFILALVGLIIAALGPATKSFFLGNPSTGKEGFSQKVMASTIRGIDESKDGVKFTVGCVANPPEITQEECDKAR